MTLGIAHVLFEYSQAYGGVKKEFIVCDSHTKRSVESEDTSDDKSVLVGAMKHCEASYAIQIVHTYA
jgi:hypothetical protein